jgi:hypothetical protein
VGTAGDGADAVATVVTGAWAPALGPAVRTGGGVTDGGPDEGDVEGEAGRLVLAGAGRWLAGADEGAAEAGPLSAACRPGPVETLIRVLTAAITAANATTPPSTVMDVRKLTSSMRVYRTSRKANSLATRDGPPGRVRVRSR